MTSEVVVFLDPAFGPAGAFFADAESSAAARGGGARVAGLAELEHVLTGPPCVLVMGHDERYPEALGARFEEFHRRGGDLVWLGGQPFGRNTIWVENGWAPGDAAGWAALGISPWHVESSSLLDPREPLLALRAEFAPEFGPAREFVVREQNCRLGLSGAGRRVVIGEMTRGASAPACPDLFAMVEPATLANAYGGRILCCGVKPGRDWSAERCAAFMAGIGRLLRADARHRLKAGLELRRVAVPQGEAVELEWAARAGVVLARPTVLLHDAAGGRMATLSAAGGRAAIPTADLSPGRYPVELLDGDTPLGLVDRFGVVASPAARPPKVSVGWEGPYAVFRVGGRALPMQSYCGYACPRTVEATVPAMRDAGIGIYHIGLTLASGWKAPGRFDWSGHELVFDRILREDPAALIFPRVRIGPPQWWVESHPQSWWQQEGGLRDTPEDASRPLYMSYYDPEWRRDTKEALAAFVRHFMTRWSRDRFLGVFYTYGGTGEWGEQAKDGLFWSDRHPALVRWFRDFLRRKYGTDEALRAAWGRIGEARFEDLRINDSQYFRATNAKHHLLDDLRADFARAREVGPMEIDRAEPPNFMRRRLGRHGVIRDPDQVRDVLDFLEAYALGFAHLQQELASTCKAAGGGDVLTGVFSGYHLHGPYEIDGGCIHTAYPEFLKTARDLDFLTSASFYWGGENPGGDAVCNSVTGAYRLHGKGYLQENDQQTVLGRPGAAGAGPQPATVRETVENMKRNWLARTVHGVGLWWFDFSFGNYEHPEILAAMARLRAISERLIRQPNERSFARDLARCNIYYSARAHRHLVCASNYLRRVGTNLPQRHWNRYGIPWEIHFPEDAASVPEARVHLFLNALALTRAEREAIERRFKRNGNLLIWLYAPGVIDESGYGIEKASELTGFTLESCDEWRKQRIEITRHDHAIARALCGHDLSDFGSVAADAAKTSPELDRMCPQVFVSEADRDAVRLGVQEGTARAAFAVKEFPEWTSVYASAAILPAAVFRALLAWKGINPHTDALDNFYTNGDLVGLNASETGYRTIRFPAEFELEDLFTGELHRSRDGKVEVWMERGGVFVGRVRRREV
jgi:hypothetical protein